MYWVSPPCALIFPIQNIFSKHTCIQSKQVLNSAPPLYLGGGRVPLAL